MAETDPMEVIKKFGEIAKKEGMDLTGLILLIPIHLSIHTVNEKMIEGKKVCDYEVYQSHFEIFKELAKKTLSDFDAFSAFGFTKEEIGEIRSSKPNVKKVSKIFKRRFGIIINKDLNKSDVTQTLFSTMTPEISNKMTATLFLSVEELNNVAKGVEEYLEINEKNKLNNDLKLKAWTSQKLYSDAFEIYMKFLKEMYSKIFDIKVNKIENDKLYEFFQTNYPELLSSTNNKLRNDVCHLTYKERGKYTTEQIDEERTTILVKAFAAFTARLQYFADKVQNNIQSFTIKDIKVTSVYSKE